MLAFTAAHSLPLQQRASSVTQAAERTDPRVLVAKNDHVADLPFDHLINYPISRSIVVNSK